MAHWAQQRHARAAALASLSECHLEMLPPLRPARTSAARSKEAGVLFSYRPPSILCSCVLGCGRPPFTLDLV